MTELVGGIWSHGSDGVRRPLAKWARYLIDLGAFTARWGRQGRALTVAVSVPVRPFAAVLCALGASAAALADAPPVDAWERFTFLAGLPAGTKLRYPSGTHLHCGTLVGVEERRGVPHLVYLETAKTLLPWDRCGNHDVLEPGVEFVLRRRLAGNPDFVSNAFPGADPFRHASATALDSLVVATKRKLSNEVLNERFSAGTNDRPSADGVLNDLLRCDAFELNANDHDRTSVLASGTADVPDKLRAARPPLVIFDEASGYVRLRGLWKQSAKLFILDRSTPSAELAAEVFSSDRAMSLKDADMHSLGPIPASIQISAFETAGR